jgi:ADP-dependent NAD(P)H-hydrate dehydratase / NAD(P)H-hydrate epimerase
LFLTHPASILFRQMNELLKSIVVSAEQMRQIETRMFEAGMPVAALMEKAAGLCAKVIQNLYPYPEIQQVGILVGSGHNGGDALVVARELHLAGYGVKLYLPLTKLKDLTAQHLKYAENLGISYSSEIDFIADCQLIIDGLFGFGLTKSIEGKIASDIDRVNSWHKPVVSLDLPSGIHTDSGIVLGMAMRATHSLCLGLWKRAFFQDDALEYCGNSQRLDFGIPVADVEAVIFQSAIRQITPTLARQFLPLPRPAVTHKYKQGHLLLICGSRNYSGAPILAALGARASGVGMLSVAVPESLKSLVTSQLPEALIIGCPETLSGAIDSLPLSEIDLNKFDVIACGCGLTMEARSIVEQILTLSRPLILDADGLNILASLSVIPTLQARKAPTILTPHLGEFKRLFPEITSQNLDRLELAKEAAKQSNSIILFKGARTAIAHPDGSLWIVSESTPALARGGSGDVLTGLMGGLLATVRQKSDRQERDLFNTVATAAWWHARSGILAATERTELGVDAFTLSQYLIPALFRNQCDGK